MEQQHVVVQRDRILTPMVVLRPWSVEDAHEAFEIYGDPVVVRAIGRREPVADLGEMRSVLEEWNLQSSQAPVPQGLWAVEAVDDGRLLGGATLLPFSRRDPDLVMGWHLRPGARGHGVAGAIGHALAHQAFSVEEVDEVFVVAAEQNSASHAVARRLGMNGVTRDWAYRDVRLEVLRMGRADLHNARPGVSMGDTYNPVGVDDW
ncbi:Protein N-acetyltransferase, RimJ/RimL family [Nocardioides terrae]|uniref:Protein N-acetyltransferase, RimJ/RimL family n=1 Tax=Nocardioides terrae TaxID=574651 RepID=A0A1I1NRX7_9ACTN|nr:GNAT family N-acetyltransferase [Nocardioides terrae]SFD00379.1 Protein N-acetyltransferase, RimJ/RimL family [Nocardioides terrae]